jgi:hypothetical protein
MNPTYCYSFDRETFTGSYNSRKDAFKAALVSAAESDSSFTSVYIGERVAGDPQASGHAAPVVEAMMERARTTAGDDAYRYLAVVTQQQLNDLDGAIEQVILRWQQLHQLKPTFFKIAAVSEHPLPAAGRIASSEGESDEVSEMGTSDYSFLH